MQLALYHGSGVCNNYKRQKACSGLHETQALEALPYAASKELILLTGQRHPEPAGEHPVEKKQELLKLIIQVLSRL
jgi:hypothetical protein